MVHYGVWFMVHYVAWWMVYYGAWLMVKGRGGQTIWFDDLIWWFDQKRAWFDLTKVWTNWFDLRFDLIKILSRWFDLRFDLTHFLRPWFDLRFDLTIFFKPLIWFEIWPELFHWTLYIWAAMSWRDISLKSGNCFSNFEGSPWTNFWP